MMRQRAARHFEAEMRGKAVVKLPHFPLELPKLAESMVSASHHLGTAKTLNATRAATSRRLQFGQGCREGQPNL